MESKGVATLKRDVDATLIPVGTAITLPVGTQVVITQEQGGFFTVYANGHLARIEGKDADVLGKEIPKDAIENKEKSKKKTSGPLKKLDKDKVWDVLKTCYDPEISVDIVNLGLIYDLTINEKKDNDKITENIVHIEMTLTSPGCGMGPFILKDVEDKVANLDDVTEVKVELVFDPPWDQSKLSEEAKLILGF